MRFADRSPWYVLLFAAVALLSLVGLVMVLSASSVTALEDFGSAWHFFRRQVLWLMIGLAAMVVTMRVPYEYWARLATPLLGVSVFLLIVVLIPGVGRNINGSSRWIGFGSLSFQPSELAKLALIVYVAELLSRPTRPIRDSSLTLWPVLAVFSLCGALLMLEPDLGTTVICGVVVVAMLLAAGTPYLHLATLSLAGTLVVGLFAAGSAYRRARVFAFLDPWEDPLNTTYQNLQSLVSIANGGISGVGIGASRGKWGFLPYAHNDFIFAVIAEETGLIGASAIVLCFAVMGVIGMIVASRVRDRFGSLLVVGIVSWIAGQAFINIGAVTGALPITGVTLPFVSLGGSALVITLAAYGIVLNVARRT